MKETMMDERTRRSFLKQSTLAAASAGLYSAVPNTLYGANAPSDRLNIAVIGLGFGATNMRYMLEADKSTHCVAMCDVNEAVLNQRSTELREKFPDNAGKITRYSDFRRVLEDKDIDGVIVATPDHWHAYIYAEACKADKAVYVEKPTGRTIAECDLMVEVQRKQNNVVTTGLWHTSLEYFKHAFSILRTGVLGDVFKVHAWISGGTDPVLYESAAQEVPEALDYKMWLGPAPSRPYAEDRVQGWRHYWDYGGGRQTDWVHYLDSALDGIAALGHARSFPKSVYSVGYRHPRTMREVPSLQTSVFQFDDLHVVWEHSPGPLYNRRDGVAWIGSKGTLVCNRTGYELIPVEDRDGSPVIGPAKEEGPYGNQYNHMANWAQCIREKSRETNSPVGKGCYATVLANIANISHRLGGHRLEYLPDEQKFRNSPEADVYVFPKYENGWDFPEA
jgi:predicted dehydrogenase